MRKLGRRTAHRKSLLQNQSIALALHGRIQTTLPKAKELRRFFEPLVTLAKEPTLNARRRLLSKLYNQKQAVDSLFSRAQLHKDRPGGYLRIVRVEKCNPSYTAAIIEFVDDAAEEKKEKA